MAGACSVASAFTLQKDTPLEYAAECGNYSCTRRRWQTRPPTLCAATPTYWPSLSIIPTSISVFVSILASPNSYFLFFVHCPPTFDVRASSVQCLWALLVFSCALHFPLCLWRGKHDGEMTRIGQNLSRNTQFRSTQMRWSCGDGTYALASWCLLLSSAVN